MRDFKLVAAEPFCLPAESDLLLLFSHSVVSDSLRHHGLQHARLPCPSPSPRACSNSCPLRGYICYSVAQSCLTLCDPMDCSMPGCPVLYHLLEFFQTHVHWVGDANQPSHSLSSHPLLLLPSIFPSIRVFSNKSVLRIRWPKDSSFSFSIILSKEHPGLISFRMDWWISLQSKGLSRVFSNTTLQKHQFFGTQPSSLSNSHVHTWPQEKL